MDSFTTEEELVKKQNSVSAINRRQILEEAKLCFAGAPVKTKKLIDSLIKCLHVLSQADRLNQAEATDLFFHIIRLFQYKDKDNTLRRLTYIGIGALARQQAENVYVVVPKLTTDVGSPKEEPSTRAAALRALTLISRNSPTTYASIENHLRQSLLDRQPVMVSAALSSLMKIAQVNHEFLHKFSTEIQRALLSKFQMVQYHALGLLYYQALKSADQTAVSSLINTCLQEDLIKTPLATCLLVKIILKFVDETEGDDTSRFIDFIKNLLSSDNEMVEFEAARALVNLKTRSSKSKSRHLAVSHLRNFLTSNKPALRFASVRTLNQLAAENFAPDVRFWSVHRIGTVCKLHLLNKRYRSGDHITGILDFSNSNTTCAKYTVMLQCEETQQYELKQEFSLGLEKSDFMITIPNLVATDQVDSEPTTITTTTATSTESPLSPSSVLHCVLSFLFYIADKNYPKTLYEVKAGTIELGPGELETKLFSCDFPIAIHT